MSEHLKVIRERPNDQAHGPEDRAYLLALVSRVEAACATIENLSVPSAEPSWHISGEKSAAAKVRVAINGGVK